MAFENKDRQEPRKMFEAQLADALKQIARKPIAAGEKAIPEVPSVFRSGFKFALEIIGLTEGSSNDLSDEQLRILCERMYEKLNPLPPPPDSPHDTSTPDMF
jgi:hypothetical protein